MSKAILTLETLTCPSCMQKIEAAVKQVSGVKADTIKISFNSSKLKVDFDEQLTNAEQIKQAIEKIGYPVLKTKVRPA